MTRDRALWRGELLRVRGCQERRRAPPSVSGARPTRVCPPTTAPFPPRSPLSSRADHSAAPRNSSHRAPPKSQLRFQVAEPEHFVNRSEEHTSELQSQSNLVCRLLL